MNWLLRYHVRQYIRNSIWVLAIDQIHRLLVSVGDRHLEDGQRHDEAGALHLIYWTPEAPA